MVGGWRLYNGIVVKIGWVADNLIGCLPCLDRHMSLALYDIDKINRSLVRISYGCPYDREQQSMQWHLSVKRSTQGIDENAKYVVTWAGRSMGHTTKRTVVEDL
jgi:hypothetical protein